HPSPLSAADTIDGSGHTLLPALTNAHVHAWAPGQLQEAAKAGVLNILDMHGSSRSLGFFRSFKDSTNYARFYGAGPGVTVPNGHGTQFGMPAPTVDSSTSARQFVLNRVEEGSDYIKILREPDRPTVTEQNIKDAVVTAHENELLAVAHVSRSNDATLLANADVDGLVHVWFDEPIREKQLDTLAASDIFMVPTMLTVLRFSKLATENNLDRKYIDSLTLITEVNRLHKAGITLLAGTDPPNFGINYGDDLITELELLVAAGLTPTEAIQSATVHTAKAFKLPYDSKLTPGNTADMILVKGDATQSVLALREIVNVWKSGKLVKQ
ncbi:MAG: amidohydrolase family protein, partial [Bacteroidota bacterium]